MEKSQAPVAVITGGSSGIGLELAKYFGKDGYRLLLVAKPEEELNAARGILRKYTDIDISTIAMDLAVEGAAQRLYDTIKRDFSEIAVLVNSAGFGTYGYFNEISIEREREMIQLNLVTLYELNRLFVADMIQRDKGKILNLSSQSGYFPTPRLACYAAIKAFVLNYSEAVTFELKKQGSKVRVLALCPPATRTNFEKIAGMENQSHLYHGFFSMDVEQVGREGYRAFRQNKNGYIPGPLIRFLTHLLNKILPANLKMRVVADANRPLK